MLVISTSIHDGQLAFWWPSGRPDSSGKLRFHVYHQEAALKWLTKQAPEFRVHVGNICFPYDGQQAKNLPVKGNTYI